MQYRRPGFNPWVGKISWRMEWQPIQERLPGEFRGQRSLVGYNQWGFKESDMTEQVMHTDINSKKIPNMIILQRQLMVS